MLLTREGKPFASSLIAGFMSGFVVSALVVAAGLDALDQPRTSVYVAVILAPLVLGLGLLLSSTWRDFGLGMVLATVAVVLLAILLLAYVAAAIGSQLG